MTKAAESRVEASNKLLKLFEVWKLKLKEEFAIVRNSSEIAIWQLEARVAKKNGILTKKQAYTVEVETRLGLIEGLLYMTNEKVKAVEEHAVFVVARTIKEYKRIEDFEQDVTEAGVDIYLVAFVDCKDKVAQVYPQLDLSKISVVEVAPKEGEEERVAEEEAVGTEGLAIEGPKVEVVIIEGLEELVTAPE